MHSAEIELKFPIARPGDLAPLLEAAGFRLVTPRTFEQNTLYDTPERSLRTRHQLLRVRQYGGSCVLTHKRQPEDADDSRYKTRIETETTVGDREALVEIFHQLGFYPAFSYEKYRTEWNYGMPEGEAHLVIDETPIGNWVELEGPTHWIDRMLTELKVDSSTCLTESYGRLFLLWKERTGSPAENMTFEEVLTPDPAIHR